MTTSLLDPGEGTNSQPVISTCSLTLGHDPELVVRSFFFGSPMVTHKPRLVARFYL